MFVTDYMKLGTATVTKDYVNFIVPNCDTDTQIICAFFVRVDEVLKSGFILIGYFGTTPCAYNKFIAS